MNMTFLQKCEGWKITVLVFLWTLSTCCALVCELIWNQEPRYWQVFWLINLSINDRHRGLGVKPAAEQQHAEKEFESTMLLPLRVIKAAFEVLLSHSDLLCYFAMVLNAMVTGSLCAIVYPVLAFLWAMLSSPRPGKAFWVFAITYTEVGNLWSKGEN